MSVYFAAMLVTSGNESEAINVLNASLRLSDIERHQEFKKIDMSCAGGNKYFVSADVYAACFNYFGPDQVEPCILDTPWSFPENVLYIVELADYYMPDYDKAPSLSSRSVADIRRVRDDAAKISGLLGGTNG